MSKFSRPLARMGFFLFIFKEELKMIDVKSQLELIKRGADEIIGFEELEEKLKSGKRLTIKLGLDPSAPDIHLGHTVVLRKIRQFQDMGHNAVIVIGDFTGMIGDPTGKSKTRKALTREQVMENARTYESQVFKVLDKDKTIIRYNSEWIGQLSMEELISLASSTTVARMLEREDFKNRFQSNTPISIHEFLYPLLQGYDSVVLKADVELGGTDQRFNVLMGRMLQKQWGQSPQTTIFMPLLEGIDGVQKMSKSLGNYVGVDESAEVMFEKIMRVHDSLILKYFDMVTDITLEERNKVIDDMAAGVNPRDIKLILARKIVSLFHSTEETNKAEERFVNVFTGKKVPDNIRTIEIERQDFDLLGLLLQENLISSKNEGRRLMKQGAVKVNGKKTDSPEEIELEDEMVVKVGKGRFIKIIIR